MDDRKLEIGDVVVVPADEHGVQRVKRDGVTIGRLWFSLVGETMGYLAQCDHPKATETRAFRDESPAIRWIFEQLAKAEGRR